MEYQFDIRRLVGQSERRNFLVEPEHPSHPKAQKPESDRALSRFIEAGSPRNEFQSDEIRRLPILLHVKVKFGERIVAEG